MNLKIEYSKKADKFLEKNSNIVTEQKVDELTNIRNQKDYKSR